MSAPPLSPTLRERAAPIRLLALDVDGTLTDGHLWFGPQGEVMKAFSVLDGQGLALLRKAGCQLALITGRSSGIVELRARELQIADVVQGSRDKLASLQAVAARHGLAAHQVAFMGDDWPDLAPMRWCGLPAAPADAHREVCQRAHFLSSRPAGAGAVRELCDALLMAQGTYQGLLQSFLDGGPSPT